MGAFQSHSAAVQMKNHLLHQYSGSQVIEFQGPTGYWVRIRVPQDDKQKTREVFEHTRVAEGAVFMVRLD
jgi:rare lipoprotein A